MGPQDATNPEEVNWRALEEAALADAKDIAQKIVERVKQLTQDTEPHASLPDPTENGPPVS
jgi:hypothetical protein